MNRRVGISVRSDQRRTKSTIESRVSWGTQAPVRAPQALFLGLEVLLTVERQDGALDPPERRPGVEDEDEAEPGVVDSIDQRFEHRAPLAERRASRLRQ